MRRVLVRKDISKSSGDSILNFVEGGDDGVNIGEINIIGWYKSVPYKDVISVWFGESSAELDHHSNG